MLILLLAISGSFMWNDILAGVARLVTYSATCAALIQLRRRNPDADAWRAPLGNLLAVLGLAFCVFLALHMTSTHVVIMSGGMVIATLNWLVVRTRTPARGTPVNSPLV
jgi:amino acid transporter